MDSLNRCFFLLFEEFPFVPDGCQFVVSFCPFAYVPEVRGRRLRFSGSLYGSRDTLMARKRFPLHCARIAYFRSCPVQGMNKGFL